MKAEVRINRTDEVRDEGPKTRNVLFVRGKGKGEKIRTLKEIGEEGLDNALRKSRADRGLVNEERVLHCMDNADRVPDWFHQISRASATDDFYRETDLLAWFNATNEYHVSGIPVHVAGSKTPVRLQVKSSGYSAELFEKKFRKMEICVIIVKDDDTDEIIRGKLINLLLGVRNTWIEKGRLPVTEL